jgi:DNA-binding CsgD family transcriptional regulator
MSVMQRSQLQPLTPTQLILLELASQGLCNREIACQLGTTPASVSTALRWLKTTPSRP